MTSNGDAEHPGPLVEPRPPAASEPTPGGPSLSEALTSVMHAVEALSTTGVIGSVLLLDDDGVHLRHGAAPSLPSEYLDAIDGSEIGPEAGSCGTAAYRREAVIVEDIQHDPLWASYRDLASAANLRACWSTPIFSDHGELLGTFAMYYREPRAPTGDDLALIRLFVRTVALTIDGARTDQALRASLAELERTHDDLRFVLDVTTTAAGIRDTDAMLDAMVRLAVPRLADIAVIDLLEDGALRRVAASTVRSLDPEDVASMLVAYTPPAGSAHPVAVAATGTEVRGADFVADVRRSGASDVSHLRRLSISAYVCVPLRSNGATLGVLTLLDAGGRPAIRPDDADLARDLAWRVAVVLESHRLYESTRDAELRLSVLARAGELLTGSLRVESVADHLAELTVPGLGDVCEVHLIADDGSISLLGSDGPVDVATPPVVVADVLRRRTAVAVDEGDGALRTVLSRDTGQQLRWASVCPLIADAEAIGALTVAGYGPPPPARSVLPLLAGRGALALDNARRFARERTVAETLQLSLLPRHLPTVAGLDLAACYHPGARGAEVGGDWYDVIPFADGRTGLVMGDVMGRGIPAAVVMGTLRSSLRAFAVQDLGPGRVLDLLTALLAAEDDLPFATIFFGMFEPASGIMTYASAGHCPVLTADPGGTTTLEQSIDPPVGVPFDGSYGEHTVVLPAESTLVLYTDGLVERRGCDLGERLHALQDAVRSLLEGRRRTPAEICDQLVELLVGDDADADDIAVMAVRAI
jgi:GAF domain-containing protein